MIGFDVKIDDRVLQNFIRRSPARAKWANTEALKMTGGHLRGQIREFIESGGSGWPALSEVTRAQSPKKKSPLFYMGRFVRFKYIGGKAARVVIGFFPTKRVSRFEVERGGSRYRIATGSSAKNERRRWKQSFKLNPTPWARMHEYGRSFRVKTETRGAFGARGSPLKKSTKKLTIPARPMIGPVFKQEKNRIHPYYRRRFLQKFFSKEKQNLGV